MLLLYVYFVPLASGPPDSSGEGGNDWVSRIEGSGDNGVKAGKRNGVFIEHLLKPGTGLYQVLCKGYLISFS